MPRIRRAASLGPARVAQLAQLARLAWLACLVLIHSAYASRPAAAAPPSASPHPPRELQAARELFVSAEADEDAGKWDAALDKLNRVLTTKDTAGVRYHVALCEEHLGQLASAEAEYAVAETSARAEQARDVLTLVGRKRAELTPRVPRVTVRVLPGREGADVSIDGIAVTLLVWGPGPKPERAWGPMALNPGAHEVTVMPDDGRAPSRVTFAIEEGQTKTVDVSLGPAPEEQAPAAAPAVAREAPRPRARAFGGGHVAAIVEAGGAALLAGVGVGAYAASSSARDQAARYCALVSAPSAASCDAYRVPVRAWDWVALGAWAGAGALGTLAVVTWVRTPGAPARVEVGAASLRVEGAF